MGNLLSFTFQHLRDSFVCSNILFKPHTTPEEPAEQLASAAPNDAPIERLDLCIPSNIPASHRLPPELIFYIIAVSSTPVDTTLPEALDQSSTYPRASVKPEFAFLSGLNGSCRIYHEAVRKAWFYVLFIREKEDWGMVGNFGVAKYVKDLRVLSPALGRGVSHHAFMQFEQLHTAFIDAHNDFELNPQPEGTGSPTGGVGPIGQYRLVAPRLPLSLRRLYVINAHGPDVAIIKTLISYSPQLQELSISRCTLFSPRLRSSGIKDTFCTFWARFSSDHDSYFANEGIEDYAISLARELKPLQSLQALHMGLYLTPHEAISAHIRDHCHFRSEGGFPWDLPCGGCVEQFSDQTYGAEAAANEIIFNELPQLQRISWASFFTANRQDAICYFRQPETSAQEQCWMGRC